MQLCRYQFYNVLIVALMFEQRYFRKKMYVFILLKFVPGNESMFWEGYTLKLCTGNKPTFTIMERFGN